MTLHSPGPWMVGYRGMDVGCENAKIGGYTKLFDVRGWGYLTGFGHGALGLPPEEATKIQMANATLAAAAPELLGALEALLEAYYKPDERLCCNGLDCGCKGSTVLQLAEHYAKQAIAKAKGGAA